MGTEQQSLKLQRSRTRPGAAKSQPKRLPARTPPAGTLFRTLGNHLVQSLHGPGIVQPKLTIGAPNDKYEQEADRVADRVMRMPAPATHRMFA